LKFNLCPKVAYSLPDAIFCENHKMLNGIICRSLVPLFTETEQYLLKAE